MSACKCCDGCCKCDRFIESVQVEIDGLSFDVPVGKTIKELGCFYPIYIGDAVSTWRWELIDEKYEYVRSFYKSVEISIDFLDPAVIQPFTAVQCKGSHSFYSMFRFSTDGSKFKMFWGDERFLTGRLTLSYRGKEFDLDLYLSDSFQDNKGMSNRIQLQIRKFGKLNNFSELEECKAALTRNNLVPDEPLNLDYSLHSEIDFEQYASGHSFPFSYGVTDFNLTYEHSAVEKVIISSQDYLVKFLGIYITIQQSETYLVITYELNYIDENKNFMSDVLFGTSSKAVSVFYSENANYTGDGTWHGLGPPPAAS